MRDSMKQCCDKLPEDRRIVREHPGSYSNVFTKVLVTPWELDSRKVRFTAHNQPSLMIIIRPSRLRGTGRRHGAYDLNGV
jgi:hypothetical protein